MTKRKLDKPSPPEAGKKRQNPFHFCRTVDKDNGEVDQSLLDHILRFTKRTSSDGDEDIDFLLSYLLDSTLDEGFISRHDVAAMIFPWATQKTQHSSRSLRVLEASLPYLRGEEDRFLTQRILYQILPRIAAAENRELVDRIYPRLLKLYRTTMEHACRKILSDLETASSSPTILNATRDWIYTDIHLSRQGNPKTTFGLVTDVLLILVPHEKLVWDALFHPKYHMEGFFAVLRPKSFRSYQENLLKKVEQLVKSDLDRMLDAIPTLFEGFCRNSQEYGGQEVASMQWRLFCRWSSLVADPGTNTKCWARMLELVCKYHAANAAATAEPVLETITRKVLASSPSPEVNRCLVRLIRLDHALFHNSADKSHERMIQAVGISLPDTEFAQRMVDTYEKLRQQRYIISTLTNAGQSELLTLLLEADRIHVAAALHSAPLLEARALLEILPIWLAPHVLPHIVINSSTVAQELDATCRVDDKRTTAPWLDFHARCRFWLGHDHEVISANETACVTPRDRAVLQCYKLRALHSKIQREELLAMDTDNASEITGSNNYHIAVGLVEEISSGECWSIIAQHLEFWIPFAKDESLDKFLRWVLQTKDAHLLQDASFYQHEFVAKRLHYVGLLLVAEELGAQLPEPPASRDIQGVIEAVGGRDRISTESLHKARSILVVLNSIPSISGDNDVVLNLIACGLVLDHNARSSLPATTASDEVEELVKFVGELRSTVASFVFAVRGQLFGERSLARMFSSSWIRSTLEILESAEKANVNTDLVRDFAIPTGHIVRSVLLHTQPPSNEDIVAATLLVTRMGDLYKAATDKIQSSSRTSLAILFRSLVSGLQCVHWLQKRTSPEHNIDDKIASFIASLESFTLASKDMPNVCSLARCDGLFLTAVSAKDVEETTGDKTTKLQELVDLCIGLLNEVSPDSDESMFEAPCYLAGLLSTAAPCLILIQAVTKATLALHGRQNKATILLEASYCRIIESLEVESVKRAMDEALFPSTGSGLRLVRLSLQSTKSEGVVQGASVSPILTTALRYVVADKGSNSTWSVDLIEACKLIGELLRTRELHTFSEFELTIILSRMDEVIQQEDVLDGLPFSTLIQLFAQMFQRYTKSLYACVPNVVNVLKSFLVDVMKTHTSMRERKAQQYVRVCEMMVGHRDVYKKHLIGLVVEFLDKVENTRDDCLLPGVFYLLDTMTTYEMDQLNAFLDDKSRLSLRTIKQSYEKVHVFKGH